MHGFAGSEVIAKRPVAAQIALDEFCRNVAGILSFVPEPEVPGRVAQILPDLMSVPGLLTEDDRSAPADGYGRNTVFLCPHDGFSVLAMVWPAGVETPVHDHRDWCAVGVYEGAIEESLYRAVEDGVAVETSRQVHAAGACGALPWGGAPNIHRIANSTSRTAISIHVYGGNCERHGPNLDQVYTVRS